MFGNFRSADVVFIPCGPDFDSYLISVHSRLKANTAYEFPEKDTMWSRIMMTAYLMN